MCVTKVGMCFCCVYVSAVAVVAVCFSRDTFNRIFPPVQFNADGLIVYACACAI